MQKITYVSVVVCTYNSGGSVSDCVCSLLNQTYPRKQFEIIVVDDCSQDNSLATLSGLDLRLIRHKKNKGVAAARNTGLYASVGDIVVYIDDDCIANSNWLSEIIRQYESDEIVGVGGLTQPYSVNTLTEKYMSASGYGNPAPIEFGRARNIFSRFNVYVQDMISPVTNQAGVVQVQDIYTLNSSFRRDALLSIKGFDTDLLWSEDVDLCYRLNKRFAGGRIVFTRNAVIKHKNRTRFSTYLRQIFIRSAYTYKFYAKINKIIPIFPFPVIYIISNTLMLLLFPNYIGLGLLLTPYLLYFWWLIRAIRERATCYLVFPHLQMIFELSSIFGLARGFLLTKRKVI